MKLEPIVQREINWKLSPFFRVNGQAMFPNEKLLAREITPLNPWRLTKVPKQPIKLSKDLKNA